MTEPTTTPQAVSDCRRDRRGDVLAYAVTFAFIAVLILLIFKVVPEGNNRDLLLVLIGVLAGLIKDVYGFQFGSSQGSQNKTDQLTTVLNQPKEP